MSKRKKGFLPSLLVVFRYIIPYENIYKLTSNEGDLNDDGDINILDVISLVNLVLNDTYSSVGDINSDNAIDILDIVLLINFILDLQDPSGNEFSLSDINNDAILNVLDIVSLVNLILDN